MIDTIDAATSVCVAPCGNLEESPGNGDRAHGEQVAHPEMQTHSEHQQDDAHLRQLLGDVGVRHEARRERPDRDPSDQVADDRREP